MKFFYHFQKIEHPINGQYFWNKLAYTEQRSKRKPINNYESRNITNRVYQRLCSFHESRFFRRG